MRVARVQPEGGGGAMKDSEKFLVVVAVIAIAITLVVLLWAGR